MAGGDVKRGALIAFEGCDRTGKSTQCQKLVDKLLDKGMEAQVMKFPDRTTSIGGIINNYLRVKEQLSDQAVHLLFAANRWESQQKMKQLLQKGVTLVVDRYSYSGVAYSAAKPGMDFDWCYRPEIGLPKPDLVFLLNVPTQARSERGGFGEERYENNKFLEKVHKNFLEMKADSWVLVDGNRSIEEIHAEVLKHTLETIEKVQGKELKELR